MDLNPFHGLAAEPTSKDDFEGCICQDEVISFLEVDINDDHILLYGSMPHFHLHAVLVR